MRYTRNIEDESGDLVELVYYCRRFCYAGESDPSIASLTGGAWPCLDTELDDIVRCSTCSESISADRLAPDATPPENGEDLNELPPVDSAIILKCVRLQDEGEAPIPRHSDAILESDCLGLDSRRKVMTAMERRIQLVLRGSRAADGSVDFDALLSFGNAFQRAIRAQARSRSGLEPTQRGAPGAEVREASSLRLVGLREGSTILEFEPAEPQTRLLGEPVIATSPAPLAWSIGYGDTYDVK